ncbi:MAG TPA: hypothetical protein PL110_03240 [Candidatus Eremiobacteraeota bacterium]|nr:MAG: hypothetical protein BWY64_00480 [bacterium ADurb.Bin363]HPZ07102.1 hypothetical protein [Candidatus Eremiobacteraeota bacterium]
MIINSHKKISAQSPVNTKVQEEKADKDQVIKSGNQIDSEIARADQLKNMQHKSTLGDNIKELIGGLVDGTSKPGTIGAVIGGVALGGAVVAFGGGALIALGAGAVGFVAGGIAGLWYDLSHHLM